ncbi:hypothetical protein L665_03663 [Ralstonia solanacearum SD54]|nr:hypothetical protein F504_2498 [Ralstonia pseudosolanacearum FQY_4]ANH32177.1 hypothetical protein A3768_1007 [Ralstonia solanacearum]ESS47280.1 hypothetical protein L665_03663 [Ralstonia solanacearum SD54]
MAPVGTSNNTGLRVCCPQHHRSAGLRRPNQAWRWLHATQMQAR